MLIVVCLVGYRMIRKPKVKRLKANPHRSARVEPARVMKTLDDALEPVEMRVDHPIQVIPPMNYPPMPYHTPQPNFTPVYTTVTNVDTQTPPTYTEETLRQRLVVPETPMRGVERVRKRKKAMKENPDRKMEKIDRKRSLIQFPLDKGNEVKRRKRDKEEVKRISLPSVQESPVKRLHVKTERYKERKEKLYQISDLRRSQQSTPQRKRVSIKYSPLVSNSYTPRPISSTSRMIDGIVEAASKVAEDKRRKQQQKQQDENILVPAPAGKPLTQSPSQYTVATPFTSSFTTKK